MAKNPSKRESKPPPPPPEPELEDGGGVGEDGCEGGAAKLTVT
jgi:hypothetical protein